MPTVIRVFEATTQRETTKKADCSEGKVGWKPVMLFGKVCPLTNCVVVSS